MKNNQETNIDALYGKIPPQAVEVEEAVLGALLLERDSFEVISGIIDTQSFYKNEHQKIFETIKSISLKNKPVDLLTVTQELKNTGLLDEVGGATYITKLTRRVASASHIEAHARIIAEKYYQRETIRRATELINLAFDGEDVEVIGNLWRQSGESLEDVFAVADTGSHIREVIKSTLIEIEKDCDIVAQQQTPGIRTGFAALDSYTGGWRSGNLIVLAARPSVGKSNLSLHFAVEAAKCGKWVNFFGFEMMKEDLTRILIAGESRVPRSDIRDGYIQDKDWNQINHAITKLEKLPILFRDSAGMTIHQVQSMIRKNRKAGRCDFAIIDYLQLIKSADKKAIREQEVSEISRTLKTIALNEKIPVMALSQLNRIEPNEKPGLVNLRESGAIEQDADIVIFIFRPEPSQQKIKISIAKHRRGRLGEMDIYHSNGMSRFYVESAGTTNPNERIESGTPY